MMNTYTQSSFTYLIEDWLFISFRVNCREITVYKKFDSKKIFWNLPDLNRSAVIGWGDVVDVPGAEKCWDIDKHLNVLNLLWE